MARLASVCTAISGPPSHQTANSVEQQKASCQSGCPRVFVTLSQMARICPAYVMRHGPFLARLVFANEKACLSYGLMRSPENKVDDFATKGNRRVHLQL